MVVLMRGLSRPSDTPQESDTCIDALKLDADVWFVVLVSHSCVALDLVMRVAD